MTVLDRVKGAVLNDRGDNRKAGITWAQPIGNDECPYVVRWVLNFGIGSLRLHHWFASDDRRALHDHPWWFVTLVLKGGYTDISQHERDHLSVGSVRFRPALHAHTVSVDEGGCWTVMLTGKHVRDWGFYTPEGWMRMRRYFRRYGHHPCES